MVDVVPQVETLLQSYQAASTIKARIRATQRLLNVILCTFYYSKFGVGRKPIQTSTAGQTFWTDLADKLAENKSLWHFLSFSLSYMSSTKLGKFCAAECFAVNRAYLKAHLDFMEFLPTISTSYSIDAVQVPGTLGKETYELSFIRGSKVFRDIFLKPQFGHSAKILQLLSNVFTNRDAHAAAKFEALKVKDLELRPLDDDMEFEGDLDELLSTKLREMIPFLKRMFSLEYVKESPVLLPKAGREVLSSVLKETICSQDFQDFIADFPTGKGLKKTMSIICSAGDIDLLQMVEEGFGINAEATYIITNDKVSENPTLSAAVQDNFDLAAFLIDREKPTKVKLLQLVNKVNYAILQRKQCEINHLELENFRNMILNEA